MKISILVCLVFLSIKEYGATFGRDPGSEFARKWSLQDKKGSTQIRQESREFPCDRFLENFPYECDIQSEYRLLKREYKEIGLDIRQISAYMALRFINAKHYKESSDDKKRKPWRIYGPKPKTWLFWRKGALCAEAIGQSMRKRSSFHLDLPLLKVLHTMVIDKELLGGFREKFFSLPYFKNKIPQAGEIRRAGHYSSSFRERDFTKEQKKHLKNFDILGSNGKPLVKATFFPFTGIGKVSYPKSKDVPRELDFFIDKYNEKIKSLFMKKDDVDSPIERITDRPSGEVLEIMAEMQRHYIAVHPFYEGNGRISRLIQDILAVYFDLPFITGGYLQSDLVYDRETYVRETKLAYAKTMGKLKKCLFEFKATENSKTPQNIVSAECSPLLSGYERFDPPEIVKEKKAFEKVYKESIPDENNVCDFKIRGMEETNF